MPIIKEARVIVSCPGRNFVTLKLITDEGVYGLGDATLNGRELAVRSYLEDHVVPCLIGRDAHRIEDIWQYLYRGAYWRRGPVTMSAIAAVDMALWDIKGKIGGSAAVSVAGRRQSRRRHGLQSRQWRNHRGHHRAGAEVSRGRLSRHSPAIWRAGPRQDLRCDSRDKGPYEPANAALPQEASWSTVKYLPSVAPLFAAAREALGPHVHLLHDVHHRLTPIEAARLCKDLEPYRPFWVEDAVPAENQANFRLIRQHSTTPLAVGEVFNSIWDCKQLIEEQLIDYIRATIVHAGGITHLRRIASFADLHNVRTGFHGATDLSPVCMAAALHFDLAVPNFGLQEHMGHTPETLRAFPHHYRFENGYMHPGEAPGPGRGHR